MHVNIWNICNSKERLAILETTHAHKRHLQGIIFAKSAINTNNNSLSKSPNNTNSTFTKTNKQTSSVNLSSSGSRLKVKNASSDLHYVGKNLQTYSSINRLIKKKAIEEENDKILSRIITTAPTLNHRSWAKTCEQNERYKENLHRKYRQLDYSKQALKLLRQSPKFRLIKMPFATCRPHNNSKIRC